MNTYIGRFLVEGTLIRGTATNYWADLFIRLLEYFPYRHEAGEEEAARQATRAELESAMQSISQDRREQIIELLNF